jgi:glucosamine-6-phosphate deaminase
MVVQRFQAGQLKVEVHPSSDAAGEAAAIAISEYLQMLKNGAAGIGVVFATGASQLNMLHALTSIPDLPWTRIIGFHLDEYEGISPDHPASFRKYLRERLRNQVAIGEFYEIDGNTADPDLMCREYIERLQATNPQICLLGIGENGHLAFNDPAEAKFDDPLAMKLVQLDVVCRRQQLAEGWFSSLEEVPQRAFTLTIPTVFQIPKLFISIPGYRKAEAVRRTLVDPVATSFPATILRSHPDATVYLDQESAAGLSKEFGTVSELGAAQQ